MNINNLVETHCHILPGIDDGAKDVETSLNMIKELQNQGAKRIIVTPHYYSDSISLDDFVAKRDRALAELKSALPEGSPEIIPAAEVFITRYLFHNDDLSPLCFGKNRYILIEHPFSSSFSDESYERLLSLCCDYGMTPILAHIERYPALMSNEDKLDRFINMGCLAQVNISSFVDSPRLTRKKLFKYLDSGRIHLIGSDCHNLTSRPPEYEKGAKKIIKKCGEDALNRLIQNANSLFE